MTTAPQRLPRAEFAELIRVAPLVSIDLVVRDQAHRVLLGLRNFEPAKGCYFVPGGRILKNEPLADAFTRICRAELGLERHLDDARFLGVFEHFYATAMYGDTSTHYVVLAYEIRLDSTVHLKHDDQHAGLSWLDEAEILGMPDAHEHTKAYFRARQKA